MLWHVLRVAIFLGFNISSDINVSYSVLLIRHHIMRWLDYFYKLHTNGGGLLIANNITRFTYTLQYFFFPVLFCVFLCYQTCYSKYPRIPSSKTKIYIYIFTTQIKCNPNLFLGQSQFCISFITLHKPIHVWVYLRFQKIKSRLFIVFRINAICRTI